MGNFRSLPLLKMITHRSFNALLLHLHLRIIKQLSIHKHHTDPSKIQLIVPMSFFTIQTLALLSNFLNALFQQIECIEFLNIHYLVHIIMFKACVRYLLFVHQMIAPQKL